MSTWSDQADQLNADCFAVFGEADPDADPSGPDLRPLYIPVAGAPFRLNGVFDEAFLAENINDSTSDFSTVDPVFGVRLADFPAGLAPGADDKLFVPRKNTTYVVRNDRPDGRGWVLLDLLKVSSP
ncbi:MAG: hypothetical protein P4L73_19250 [Caulobacteraceae bacterium]|nr:hypothetical protein [Caulobacteraceae bacterium]